MAQSYTVREVNGARVFGASVASSPCSNGGDGAR